MAEYLKAWITVLFLSVMIMLLTGIVMASMEVSTAESYHSTVIAEIENSNFNNKVIEACISEADDLGYHLRIQKLVTDSNYNKQIADVELEYNYHIGILKINKSHKIRGTAR